MAKAVPQVLPRFSDTKSPLPVANSNRLKQTGWTVQSPYTEKEHQLNLDTLNFECAVLTQTLALIEASRDDYVADSYAESFNWANVTVELKRAVRESDENFRETSFYIVAFRSQKSPALSTAILDAWTRLRTKKRCGVVDFSNKRQWPNPYSLPFSRPGHKK